MKQEQNTENNVTFTFTCSKGQKEIITMTMTHLDVTDNRKFWKTIRPLLANKTKVKNKITLNEDSQSIKDDQKVANILTLSL